jgi:hypothetical protein
MEALVLEMVNVRPLIESITFFINCVNHCVPWLLYVKWMHPCDSPGCITSKCTCLPEKIGLAFIYPYFTGNLIVIHMPRAHIHVLATNVFILYRHKPRDRTRQPLRAMSRNLVLEESR